MSSSRDCKSDMFAVKVPYVPMMATTLFSQYNGNANGDGHVGLSNTSNEPSSRTQIIPIDFSAPMSTMTTAWKWPDWLCISQLLPLYVPMMAAVGEPNTWLKSGFHSLSFRMCHSFSRSFSRSATRGRYCVAFHSIFRFCLRPNSI